MRSPYSDWNMGKISPEKDHYVKNMAKDGYIFVFQNIRGKQKSEGRFIMEPGIDPNDKTSIDEASDTYDLIEWLLKNTKNNGRVGQLGISYPGELALISAVKPHPALKAVSPQSTVADFFIGDDFFHNGAFRLSFAFEYCYGEEAVAGDTTFSFPMYDLFDWYLQLGPLSNVNAKYFHERIPSWNDFIKHPGYDNYWKAKAPLNYTDVPHVPILHVGAYWDQEDRNGPEMLYGKMEKYDSKNLNYLVMGPWYHGQWADSNASSIGEYTMGRNTAAEFRMVQKQWFDYWLKDKGDGKFAEALCYQTGSNEWKQYTVWPPKNVEQKKLYLATDNGLSFDRPAGENIFDSYVSDPQNPVTYRKRPIEVTYSDSSEWDSWLVQDQRQVDHRPDVLTYKSAPLDADVTITGDVVAHLFAAITGSDADWVVKLIDVYPDMYQERPCKSQTEIMITGDIFRGRFRHGFSKPEAITPGKIEEYTISLNQVNHVFQKGHRIMVQIQSSWFPLYDRNPQKYVPNIFLATESDFIKSTQSIYRSGKYATYISLPVVEPEKEKQFSAK
jgi:uncharacterized protein